MIGGVDPGGVGRRDRGDASRCHPEATPRHSWTANPRYRRGHPRVRLIAGIVDARLSRGLAGVSGSTLVGGLAGSRYAVRDGMATLNRWRHSHRAVVELGDLIRIGCRAVRFCARARPVGWRWCPTAAVPPGESPVRLRGRSRISEQHDLGVARLLDLPFLRSVL